MLLFNHVLKSSLFLFILISILPPNLYAKPLQSKLQIEPAFINAMQNFSFDIFNSCLKDSQYKNNLFISPYSIASAITLIYNGSEGKTKTEIENALYFKNMDIEKLNAGFLELKKYLINTDSKVNIEIANSLWSKKGLEYKEKYVKFNKYYHDAEIKTLTDAKTINDWVSEKTHEKIKDIISENNISGSIIALVNAVYFKGEWSAMFPEKATEEEEFNGISGKTKCSLMCNTNNYNYFSDEKAQAIELSYGDNKFGMYVFLPSENIDFKEFALKFNGKSFIHYTSKLEKCRGTIKFPKMKTEYMNELSTILKTLGIKDAFDSNADFSKIFNTKVTPLYISKVIHKAFIDINEKGAEAAAATVIYTKTASLPAANDAKNFEMTVNRPFIFAIADIQNKTILFMGAIVNPELK